MSRADLFFEDGISDNYGLGQPAFDFEAPEQGSSSYGILQQRNVSFGMAHNGVDDDDILEDIGFFGRNESSDAQRALNELGLMPSSPMGGGHLDHDDIMSSAEDEHGTDSVQAGSRHMQDGVGNIENTDTTTQQAHDDDDGFDLDRELENEDELMAGRTRKVQSSPIQKGTCAGEEIDHVAPAEDGDWQLEEEPAAFQPQDPECANRKASEKTTDASAPTKFIDRSEELREMARQEAEELARFQAMLQESDATNRRSARRRECSYDFLSMPGGVARGEASSSVIKHGTEIGTNGLPRYMFAGTARASLLDGSVAHFERRKRSVGWKPQPVHYDREARGLLSRPVHQIIDRIEAAAAERVADEADRSERIPVSSSSVPTEMWQERYRPSRFTELVGEERTHREVLGWIKDWDACVFGRRADKKRMRQRFEQQQASSGTNNFQKPFAQDKWMRPRERVLLLGGPAGMGKTTLAHVAAKTCGYNVHELNASDDRTARTVEDRVRDAIETKSLQSSLPTCLILDEVDGATGGGSDASAGGGGFVKALIKLIEGGNASTSNGGKRKKSRPLLRPIICVCNDPYAAPLRALRPYAKMVRLNRPSTPALLARLRQICEREHISADTAGLNMLIEMCQGDVRSCLNALQLLQSDHRGITVAMLKGTAGDRNSSAVASALSSKDGNASVNHVWTKLFRSQTARERDRQRSAHSKRSGDSSRRADDKAENTHAVVSSVINSGEMDKILAGCFEHYPNLKLVDDGWWRFKKAHDWIYWYEHLNQRGWDLGNHTEMWGYLPWSFACWRLYFANTANELPEYPRVDYQQHIKRTAFDEVALEVFAGLPPATRSQFDRLSLVTELGPLLTPILTPDLKPINSQLIRAEEKATLASVVSIMDHTNVTFMLDKNEHGHSYYRFDPPLEIFSHFEGKRVTDVSPPARFNVRQMLASEVRAKKLRDRQIASGGKITKEPESLLSSNQRRTGKEDEATPRPKEAPKAKVAVDFFGRPIALKKGAIDGSSGRAGSVPSLPSSILERRQEKENCMPSFAKRTEAEMENTVKLTVFEVDEQPSIRPKIKVFYHYHEGYSNAVRKPIKMSALLS